MSEFYRFPRTPHLAWLGDAEPRDDKLLTEEEIKRLLSGPVRVEEKLDGANLGLSVDRDGRLQAQNRGHYLEPRPQGQFSRLPGWLGMHHDALRQALGDRLILFGEWCAARHSVSYDVLPDWYLAFDLYDKESGQFWSSERRDRFCAELGITVVPTLYGGTASLPALTGLVGRSTSRFGPDTIEGIIIRCDDGDWLSARAKLVGPDFTQAIDTHWRSRSIVWNRLAA
ncbi:RNA ligase family protein [Candidatus Thiosymbion oneisti]|uniref:RNA ligase family protein n=1 Tax=Candidatus Thiosymbion oneisti TaxID=589554 RepID=UPI000A6EE120|nr:RNA ligase family protein [Candidatus Thiosymbion oneisti]